eukprot:TRINITY_DN102161_c0_g1_i1.p1 TRINITY_DN102161_c0_g1~~TRINITY_DN102161_c0_g1_i1.p1  ORF type:complete len:366 (-),score=56.56 TRINITY_DN102161_c0_g1_i1:323-1357(-)
MDTFVSIASFQASSPPAPTSSSSTHLSPWSTAAPVTGPPAVARSFADERAFSRAAPVVLGAVSGIVLGVSHSVKRRDIDARKKAQTRRRQAVQPPEEQLSPEGQSKVKFTVVDTPRQAVSGTTSESVADGLKIGHLIPDPVKSLFKPFCLPLPTKEDDEYRVSQYPLSAERLRPGAFEDMPWIFLTVASLGMSPLGISEENFVVADSSSRVGFKPIPDGRLGFAQMRPLLMDNSGPALVSSLFVVPEFRRCGLGARLVQELLARRRRNHPDADPTQVYALTLSSRVGFFQKQGFGIVATSREDDGLPSLEEVSLPLPLLAEASIGMRVAKLVAGEALVVLRVVG